ncbi:MAG: cyclic nucleotide-binding domain-containing protein [Nitrospirae bacterium YQR-1]
MNINKLDEVKEISELLREVSFFSSFSDVGMKMLAKKIQIRHMHKSEEFLHCDTENFFMYIILQGKVKIYRINSEGKAITLAIRQEGDYFGEISI